MSALDDAVAWLDSLELKIFSSGLVRSCEEQLLDNEVLFKEMTSFQNEIQILNSACAEIMKEGDSAPRKDRADRIMVQLKSRVGDLESAIRERDTKAQSEAIERSQYQILVKGLFQKLERLRDHVLDSLRRFDLTLYDKRQRLDDHEKEFKSVERELTDVGSKLRDRKGDFRSRDFEVPENNNVAILGRLLDDVGHFIQQLATNIANDEELKVSWYIISLC